MSQLKKTSTSSHSDFAIECDKTDSINSLQGQLLIASPHMDDTRFKRSVIMMCQHDAQSAMGLVINNRQAALSSVIFMKSSISEHRALLLRTRYISAVR